MYSEKIVNVLPVISLKESATQCCPLINPHDWDSKIFEFDKKLFARASTRSIMHIPLNMDRVMKDSQAKIDAANATGPTHLVLSEEISPWRADHYFAVSRDVPGMKMAKLTGTYLTKVYEGPFKEMGGWYKQLNKYVESQGYTAKKIYFFYTACPKCADIYGKNYVIGFARVT